MQYDLKFDDKGLVCAIAVDVQTSEVLMQAYMNQEAFDLTLKTRRVHYFSRSRQKLWLKGETSGNFQEVVELSLDCDRDCVLIKVRQTGPACHTGSHSCFFNKILP